MILEVANDGRVCIEIQKGMYGLPQAGILASKLLQQRLPHGYRPTEHTLGLCNARNVTGLVLVVNDLGIKYVGHEHAEHLKASIEKHYEISCELTGSAYCRLKIKWDYNNKIVDLSIPGYIKAAIHKFQHLAPARPEHAPHAWNPPVYGTKAQYIEEPEDSPTLSPTYVT
jgi:hypothetical protein